MGSTARPADEERRLTGVLAMALKAQEQQGERISRILHDEVAPLLSAIGLEADLLRMDLAEKSPELSGRAAGLQKLLEEAVVQVRNLSQELHPAMVERAGLQVALERLAARRRASFSGALRLAIDASVRLPAAVAAAVYRIAEQALDNAVRHAGCSWIEVSVRPVEGVTTLEVIDDGRGFSVEEASEQGRGLGLQLMRYHATCAGLPLSITSAPGKGTTVSAGYGGPGSRGR